MYMLYQPPCVILRLTTLGLLTPNPEDKITYAMRILLLSSMAAMVWEDSRPWLKLPRQNCDEVTYLLLSARHYVKQIHSFCLSKEPILMVIEKRRPKRGL